MYSLKPIVSVPNEVPLPQVMYALPKIQGGGDTECIAEDIQRQLPLPEYDLLEARQLKILYQICELREQLDYLTVAVRLQDNSKSKAAGTNVKTNQKPIDSELIVYANPANPPYFILALQRIWKDTNLKVETHRHSTVPDASNVSFEEKLQANASSDAIHNIDVKLIWKDVNDVQLITKVYDYPLEGEANILRYLTRLIEIYSYESSKSPEEVLLSDAILDLCLRLPYEEPRNVNAITSKFASYLGASQWFVNSTVPSIIDVAIWSVIKRIAHNKVPKDLKNWYDLCEKTFLSV